jgi:hypothetical protein
MTPDPTLDAMPEPWRSELARDLDGLALMLAGADEAAKRVGMAELYAASTRAFANRGDVTEGQALAAADALVRRLTAKIAQFESSVGTS